GVQHCAQALRQVDDVEGFVDNLDGSDGLDLRHHFRGEIPGHDQDRCARSLLSEHLQDLEAADAGHVDVEQDGVEFRAAAQHVVQGFCTIADRVNPVTTGSQEHRHQVDQCGFV